MKMAMKNCCLETTHFFPVLPDTAPCRGCVCVCVCMCMEGCSRHSKSHSPEAVQRPCSVQSAFPRHTAYQGHSWPGLSVRLMRLLLLLFANSRGGQSCCLQRSLDKVTRTLKLLMLCIHVPEGWQSLGLSAGSRVNPPCPCLQ